MLEMKDFPGRQDGERIEIFVRSHPLYLLWRLLAPGFLFLLALALGIAFLTVVPSASGALIFFGLWLVFLPVLWLGWRFALWYYDYFIITDRRVIDFVSKPFLSEVRNETHLSRIQDARVVFPNFLAVTLNYGHVIAQTAAITGELSIRYIANPNRLQKKLLELVAQHQGPGSAAASVNQMIDAFRSSLDAQQPGSVPSPSPPGPDSPAEEPLSSRGQSRGVYDMVFVRSASEPGATYWRKHWLILLQVLFRPVIMMLLSLGLLILLPLPILSLLAAAAFVGGIIYMVWQTADWYNDMYIVTENRIIDVEKVPFVSEDRREAQLVMIQDVNYSQPNFITRLFNFGDVIVQTAGRSGAFTFNNVPKPREVQGEIVRRWEQARKAQQVPLTDEATQDFMGLMDRYHEMKGTKP